MLRVQGDKSIWPTDTTAARDDRFQVKHIPSLLAATLLLAFVGCQSRQPAVPPPHSASQATRNNCYSLLHQLLDDQKDVSMLRFIKREHSDVKDLVKKIASTSKAGSKFLEEFAKKDPSINLGAIRLPLGEVATRNAIASTKKNELLNQTGQKFELTLLLTQTEALNYAWHLAEVASQTDSQPDRARALADIGNEMKNLYHEVFVLLLSETESSAKSQ
jgi:hypothetical protein